jgi:hypothetical protein
VTTVISDQQKGSIAAFAKVVPLAVSFFCSFHHRENIKKFVKGGNGAYSCMWLYNLLLNAKTPAAIDKHRCLTMAEKCKTMPFASSAVSPIISSSLQHDVLWGMTFVCTSTSALHHLL